jgi:tetrahydromethanopterin S-methyltransferase subunit E
MAPLKARMSLRRTDVRGLPPQAGAFRRLKSAAAMLLIASLVLGFLLAALVLGAIIAAALVLFVIVGFAVAAVRRGPR